MRWNLPFFQKGNKIGKRLITLIIAFSSLITFFITALQLFIDYQEQRSDLDTTLNDVVVNVPTISGSVWSFDEEQINLSLEALVNLKNIEFVSAHTSNSKNSWEKGTAVSDNVIIRNYPLSYEKRGETVEIGNLKVIASLDAIYERVLSKALGILISNGIKTFFVALFMFAIFYRLVAKRIEILANKVEGLTNELVKSDINGLYKPQEDDDEIESVQHSFDHMASKLRNTVNALEESNRSLQHAYEEVSTINSELELRVHERTQHLQQEIVERQFMEKSLKYSEHRLRDIAESASDWFWETDPDSRFTYVSGRCYEVTGLSPDDVIGKSRYSILANEKTDTSEKNWEAYQQIVQNQLPIVDFIYHLHTPHGKTLIIQLNGLPFYDFNDEFQGYRGAARDITDQITYQEKLKEAKKLADIANKAKSEFISSMSHELRTPLNGILGFAQLLEMNPKKGLDKQQLYYVDHIINAGQHLLNLINEILDLAKVESGKVPLSIEPISPIDVINDSLPIFHTLAERKNIVISTDYKGIDTNIRINADLTRFSQVIMNLCSNAIKYNFDGGKITIQMDIHKDKWLIIKVIDTGPGIPKELQSLLFTPFNRLQAEGSQTEGTGVGLSISQKLVHMMNGEIGVESNVNEGSTFWCRFNIADIEKNQNNNELKSNQISSDSIHPCHVLYVEDNPENMSLVEGIFNTFDGANLSTAVSISQGLSMARENAFDIILLDLNMPEINGFDGLKEFRKIDKYTETPILALSADVHPDTIKQTEEEGFNGFITKPVDIPVLISKLNSFLAT